MFVSRYYWPILRWAWLCIFLSLIYKPKEISKNPANFFATTPFRANIFERMCFDAHFHRWQGKDIFDFLAELPWPSLIKLTKKYLSIPKQAADLYLLAFQNSSTDSCFCWILRSQDDCAEFQISGLHKTLSFANHPTSTNSRQGSPSRQRPSGWRHIRMWHLGLLNFSVPSPRVNRGMITVVTNRG